MSNLYWSTCYNDFKCLGEIIFLAKMMGFKCDECNSGCQVSPRKNIHGQRCQISGVLLVTIIVKCLQVSYSSLIIVKVVVKCQQCEVGKPFILRNDGFQE